MQQVSNQACQEFHFPLHLQVKIPELLLLEQGRHSANSCKKAWILLNFVEFTWIYLNLLEFAIFDKRVTDGQTQGPTDRPTDGQSLLKEKNR